VTISSRVNLSHIFLAMLMERGDGLQKMNLSKKNIIVREVSKASPDTAAQLLSPRTRNNQRERHGRSTATP